MSKAAKATVGLMIISMLSKILGFIREQVLSYVYGIGIYAEAYITAMNIPGVVFAAIGTALITTFIPLYIESNTKNGEKATLKFVNNTLNIVTILSLILAIIGFIFAEPIVKLFAMSFEGEKLSITVNFLRTMIFGIIFLALSNIMTSILQANDKFVIAGLITIPYNIILIVSILISGKTGIYILPIGVVIAMLSQFLTQVPFVLKFGYKYKPYINLKDEYLKKMLWLVGPVFIGVAVNQINTIVDRSIASTLGDGIIPALSYASRLDGFVQGLFIASVSAVIYPTLSKLSSDNNREQISNTISTGVNTIICLVAPISVGAIVLSYPIVKLVFERGAFDSHATTITATALTMYSIGMIANGLRDILGKVFYSFQDTKTPMVNGVITVIMNIILNIVLSKMMGYAGLPLATSISAIICTMLLFVGLVKRIGYFGQDKILKTAIKSLISAVVMGVVVFYVFEYLNLMLGVGIISEALGLGISVLIGALIYGMLMIIFRVEEVVSVLVLVKKKINRK